MYNCALWDSPWGDGFYKQVEGYSSAGAFLYHNYCHTSCTKFFYPLVFLYRNAIEITLKRLIIKGTEKRVEPNVVHKIRNSHLLYKDLWLKIKPVLLHYSEAQNYDIEMIELADHYFYELNLLDKNSDTFRYPFTRSFEYKIDNIEFDFENVHLFFRNIFKFIDNCNDMLDGIYDYESEMLSYYSSEIVYYYD